MIGEPLIFDTSIWIGYLHDKSSPAIELLENYIQYNHQVLLTPVIVQEVLQGIRNDYEYLQVKDSLLGFRLLHVQPLDAAIGAADLYRNLRKKGLTIRKTNDCLIAYYALYHDVALIHNDSDYDLISRHSSLRARKS
jgi:predicted nucleic acid-binding protein